MTNPRLTQPLNPEMGPTVLAHLGKFATLPARGIVAGQAVASALEDIYGGGGGVYNDVDVFMQLLSPVATRFHEGKMLDTVENFELTISNLPRKNEDYDHLKLVPTLTSNRTYTVEGTSRRDLLNMVFYKSRGKRDEASYQVLSGFDLNCVRVGVDLASKRLIWDRHYAEFLATSEVRIVVASTPLHSLMRLLKKKQELPKVHINLEASAVIANVMRQREVVADLQPTRHAAYWFGPKYIQLARTLKEDLAPYFSLEEAWLQRNAKGALVRGDAGDETTNAAFLGTLKARGKPDAASSPKLHSWTYLNTRLLPGQVYRAFERQATGKIAVPAAWQAKLPEEGILNAYGEAYGVDYLDGLKSLRQAQDLAKQLKTLPESAAFDRSAVQQLDVMAGVRDEATAQGACDVDYVAEKALQQAAFDSNAKPAQLVERVLKTERGQVISRHAGPVQLNPAVWANLFPSSDASVVLLSNMREVHEFRHNAGWVEREFDSLPWNSGVHLGVRGGRHGRDVAVYQFWVDEATQLLDWTFRVHRRSRMPQAMAPTHLTAIFALFQSFEAQGFVHSFRSSPKR